MLTLTSGCQKKTYSSNLQNCLIWNSVILSFWGIMRKDVMEGWEILRLEKAGSYRRMDYRQGNKTWQYQRWSKGQSEFATLWVYLCPAVQHCASKNSLWDWAGVQAAAQSDHRGQQRAWLRALDTSWTFSYSKMEQGSTVVQQVRGFTRRQKDRHTQDLPNISTYVTQTHRELRERTAPVPKLDPSQVTKELWDTIAAPMSKLW